MNEYLLLETGFKIELEDSSGHILLESSTPVIDHPIDIIQSINAVGPLTLM